LAEYPGGAAPAWPHRVPRSSSRTSDRWLRAFSRGREPDFEAQPDLEDIVDLEDEALAETGNIILNSWVATIANLLKSALKMSLPIVIRGNSKQMFESATSSLVLFLHIKFEIRQKEIGGYVALLMDIPSLDELRSLIAEFVGSVTQDESTKSTTKKS
jgi:hypothetical protein